MQRPRMARWHPVIALFTLAASAAGLVADGDCHTVVFDETDKELDVRTMVVEDGMMQRSLVLLGSDDRSEPCTLKWWLDHNPQGVVPCGEAMQQKGGDACAAARCVGDSSQVELGYVRTMLASAAFTPQSKSLSAICLALGCRTRVRKAAAPTTLLQAAPEIKWNERPQPKRILVIGLGSSTMALWLRRSFPSTDLDVAEIVPGVAKAAPCFGLNTNDTKLHLHVGDGRAFLENSAEGSYDAILVDAFDSNASLPACFRTSSFFASARKALAPGGALSLNLLGGKTSKRILQSMVNSFSSHVWVGEAPGAEGIQNIITAFAPGHSSGAQPGAVRPEATAALNKSKGWLSDARYRLLNAQVLDGVHAFEDVTECPSMAPRKS